MTFLDTKELYALFLDSDWWINLSREKRRQVGHCERCPVTERLQSHHRFYRDNWFDTLPEDLEVLCRSCHEREHGIATTVTVTVSTTETTVLSERSSVEMARSRRQISRKQYLVLREQLIAAGRWEGGKLRKKKTRKRRRQVKLKKRQFCAPWHYSPRRTHWVNRGSSSN